MSAAHPDARLIIAASETDADLYYATRFLAPDAFVFLQTASEKMLLVSDLELDRARAQAQVDVVVPLSHYQQLARKNGVEAPTQLDALHQFLTERGIRSLQVPKNFPIYAADTLRKAGYEVDFPSGAFFPEREIKTPMEIDHIRDVQRHVEAAMEAAVTAIRETTVSSDGVLYRKGEPLTSEAVRRIITLTLLDRDCTARHTIVACGNQACDLSCCSGFRRPGCHAG